VNLERGHLDPVSIATGAPASPASDLYALGVTLFEWIAGASPAQRRGSAEEPREIRNLDLCLASCW
jgi:serine/threonine protein kinase